MKSRKSFWITFSQKIILAVVNFYLFHPIIQLFIPLNQFEQARPFEWFAVLTSLLAVLVPLWFLWLPLQLALLIYAYQAYFPIEARGIDWITTQYEHLSRAIGQFFQGDLAIFPTNIALIFVFILFSFATYFLINKKRPTLIVLTCIVYLMILHTFTQYDFFPYVVRVIGLSALLLGISQVSVHNGWKQALLSFSVVTSAGYLFTQGALWATENLVPQQQWVENRSRNYQQRLEMMGVFDFIDYYTSGGGLRRMGYGENDAQLGGPVQQNFDPVFRAYDDSPHYWRISTKEYYTGQGWERVFEDFSAIIEYAFTPIEAEERVTIQVDRVEEFDYFPYTYQMLDLQIEEGDFNLLAPSMQLQYQGGDAPDSYEVTVADQDLDFSLLSELTYTNRELDSVNQYLQLPDNIPDRVWELAAELTDGMTLPYEKVRAIENYLRSESGLRYSLREASHLPSDAEYVDHFLFESRVGYCDNFSTAMVVLSRMAGVPTRWAKGFNGGTQQTDENGEIFYEILNANAHSWPEVYFPEYGWIPFEPTPAFNQPLTDEIINNQGVSPTDPIDLPEEQVAEEEPEPMTAEDAAEEQTETEDATEQNEIEETVVEESTWSRLAAFFLIVVTFVVYLYRRKLYPYLIEFLIQLPFLTVRQKSTWILSLYQLDQPKKKDETLRQYFLEVAKKAPLHQSSILQFIQLQEEMMYAPSEETLDSTHAQSIMRSMIPVYRDLQYAKQKSSF